MAYNELIKKFDKIREYMRRFYVYGFWHREQFSMKSARSYDNERRRVESWLGEYISFRQEPSGKVIFLSVDGRKVTKNPLYQAFKAKSFTANDITLHFYLMDIFVDEEGFTIKEILQKITEEYFTKMEQFHVMDESTLRKKLREYEKIGLVESYKIGKNLFYRRTNTRTNMETWMEALQFYAEAHPLGVVGSYLLDKFPEVSSHFRFKHHFLLHAIDSEILYTIVLAMCEQDDIRLKMYDLHTGNPEFVVHPMKIYMSTQNGRQYLLAWDDAQDRPWFYRLDNIVKAEIVKCSASHKEEDMRTYRKKYEAIKDKLWGVSLGTYEGTEHLEMDIYVDSYEYFIIQRLEREKRSGTIEKIDEHCYRFSIDVYDAKEMIPWIRTFIGRIMRLECSNPKVTEKFYQDLQTVYELYGGNKDVV